MNELPSLSDIALIGIFIIILIIILIKGDK